MVGPGRFVPKPGIKGLGGFSAGAAASTGRSFTKLNFFAVAAHQRLTSAGAASTAHFLQVQLRQGPLQAAGSARRIHCTQIKRQPHLLTGDAVRCQARLNQIAIEASGARGIVIGPDRVIGTTSGSQKYGIDDRNNPNSKTLGFPGLAKASLLLSDERTCKSGVPPMSRIPPMRVELFTLGSKLRPVLLVERPEASEARNFRRACEDP